MKIDAITLREIKMPLVHPFRTSFGVTTDRRILLARGLVADIRLDPGEGLTVTHWVEEMRAVEVPVRPVPHARAHAGTSC